jgi:NAD(P)-dependent dehydrogenase (short-subunit alcohol dehydrogenase family)
LQRIFITGTNRGIGLEMVRLFSQRAETHVFAACRKPDDAAELKALAAQHPNSITIIPLETTDQNSINGAAEKVAAQVDGLELLINNAAINPSRPKQLFGEMTAEMMLSTLHVNAVAPLMVVQAFATLLKAGSQAKIVNISSGLGSLTRKTTGGLYGYGPSKAALNMVTRGLAADLKPFGITTISLHPGWVQTDMGSREADLTPSQSVEAILKIVDGLTEKDNGTFLRWDGEMLPW